MTSEPVASVIRAPCVRSESRDRSSTRPLRILHVIDSAGVYGAERVLLSLAAASMRKGHEVFVGTIVSPFDSADPLGETAAGQGLHHVRFVMRDGPNVGGLREIFRFARDRSIDVIHSHGYRANILLACAPQRSRRWALICTLHGWTSRGRLNRQRFYEALERRLIRRFDHVVAVSNKIAAQLLRMSLTGRLTMVPNGVEMEEHGPSQDPRRTASPREGCHAELLAVGRLGAEKGFDMLIAAMCILRDCGVAARLRIAGEGPERPKLEAQIAAHSLGGIVELLGYQAGLSSLYRAADFFVLSSRTEGLPIVLLEAMAYGTPVVASAVGEVPTVLDDGKCGWLIEHLSADDIARTLSQAIAADSVECQGRVCRARERVDTTYSAVIMTNRYLAVYLQALADRRIVGKGRLR